MTVIVTGHRGFIGGKLHTKLIEKQKDFIAYDAADPGTYPHSMPDLNNLEIKTIYHIGAVSGIEECEDMKEIALYLNVQSVQKWAELALEHNARLVFTSSMAAASIAPTWYGLTKKWAEEILLYYQQKHKLKVTIFRLPNIYGPGSFNKKSVVAKMCKDALLAKVIYVHGEGNQTRNFLHVDDVVNALLSVNRPGFYRIANGRVTTIKHLAKDLSEKFGVKIHKMDKRKDEKPSGIMKYKPDDLSINLSKDFEEGIDETAEYFKRELKKP
jgi:UDP-glucose 4-epimerase